MARTKATIRRINDFRTVARGRKRTVCPFKTKQTLPKQKVVSIKKNGQTVKTINVRRKSTYFAGKNKLIF